MKRELVRKREKGDTYKLTFECIEKGMTIEQISSFRGIQPVTVYSHIAHLIQAGTITNWSAFVDQQECDRVEKILTQRGNSTELKPIYEALNGEVEYGKIRLAIAIISAQKQTN
ncbi:MAG: helix-turn-helix domain-containing protein [Bacteroidales bacterium]